MHDDDGVPEDGGRPLAEDVMLLATLPDKGRPPLSRTEYVRPALAGALVADLVLRGRVHFDGSRLVVLDTTPVGDALLDEALEVLGSSQLAGARSARHQLKRLDARMGKLDQRVTAVLVAAGAVHERPAGRLGPFTRTRHPVADRVRHHRLVTSVRAAGEDHRAGVTLRTDCLVALLGSAKLLGHVVEHRAAARRARAAANRSLSAGTAPVNAAVRSVVSEVEAIHAAIILTVLATGT